MRLLHVASSYPLRQGDSTAPFLEEMLSALASTGHQTSVLVPRIRGLDEGYRSGVRVVGAPYAPSRLQVWGYGRSLDAANRLRPSAAAVTPLALSSMAIRMHALIRDVEPDVVHLHWALPQGVLSFLVPRGIPVVISVHGADVRFARGSLKPLAERVVGRADAMVAASSGVVRALTEIIPAVSEKTTVIPHGADGTLFTTRDKTPARQALDIDPGAELIVAVGRLVPKKGFRHLIRAMSEPDLKSAQLVILGDGPEREILESLNTGGLAGRVQLPGTQPRDKVALWMAAADVVCVPSLADGADVDSGPVVLMEAMACGRPVVASHIGMAPDVIEDGYNGFLVSSSEPKTLAAFIRRALSACEKLGVGAKESFERIGDWDRVACELEAVYSSVLLH